MPKFYGVLKRIAVGVAALTIVPLILGQSTGKISGVVIGDDGRLLAAVVTVHKPEALKKKS